MNSVEFEYEKILSNIGCDLKVINHPQFRDSFIREYEKLSNEGKCEVSVKVDSRGVNLFSQENLPYATNGIYKGYKAINSCSLYIQDRHNTDYFCVRRSSSDVYSYINGADNLGYSESLDVYLGNENVGKIDFLIRSDCMQGTMPNFAVSHPDIDLGYALNGDIPYNIGNFVGEVVCNSFGKIPGKGYANTTSYSRLKGKVDTTIGLAAINLENPYSLDTGLVNFAVMKNNHMELIDNKYSSLDEALSDIQSNYENAMHFKSL